LVFLFIYLFIVGFYERRDLFQFHSGITAGCNVISASVQEMCLSHDMDVARLHKRNKSANLEKQSNKRPFSVPGIKQTK